MSSDALDESVLDDGPALEDTLAERIRQKQFGLAIAAPPSIQLPLRRPVQVAGCHVETLCDAARRPAFDDMAILVGSNPVTGRVRATRAFPETTEADDPSPRPSDPGEGVTGTAFRVNAASLLAFPDAAAVYHVWMIARDRVSNRVRTELIPRPAYGYDDPEVARFVARWRAENPTTLQGADPRSIWPPPAVFGGYPSYRSGDAKLPLPASGIVLSAERVLVMDKGLRWILSGAYRLTIDRSHVVHRPVSGESATAVVPITLVVTGLQIAGPIVIGMRLPSLSPIKPSDKTPVASGHFSINLLTLPGVRRIPGTFHVYAVSGDILSGPATTALVSPDALNAR